MNLRDLHYLVAVADHLHFGKAAASAHVSQPTLSMQIKKLEETLGVQLIERNNRQVILTPIGHAITAGASCGCVPGAHRFWPKKVISITRVM
jgi:LysR family hydrogen peroxide-inducible transcriptional activator